MDEKEIKNNLVEKIAKDFSLEINFSVTETNLGDIKNYLAKRIKLLMSSNFDRFLTTLYRIDVDENKTREILYSKDKENIPFKLADLIIERQLQRIKTQLLYKKGKI
ncbi:hypothetical protein ABRY23_10335 [Melioribacteraceae bacterium 4301-Me]|uniref:hypothetical protein n=1 Tax=Pyranulibacter aquaticus TaxID=3163344 RepID=UPI003595A96E